MCSHLRIFSLCAAIQQGENRRICQHDKSAAINSVAAVILCYFVFSFKAYVIKAYVTIIFRRCFSSSIYPSFTSKNKKTSIFRTFFISFIQNQFFDGNTSNCGGRCFHHQYNPSSERMILVSGFLPRLHEDSWFRHSTCSRIFRTVQAFAKFSVPVIIGNIKHKHKCVIVNN